MLVVVCPGQGAQSPGMLAPWLELPGMDGRLGGYSAVVGQDLAAHGTTSDAATIRDTAVAQPLLVAAALLTFHAVFDGDLTRATGPRIDVVAGHSVGEFGAAALAGVLTEDQALDLVAVRGAAMARAAATTPTSMSAVLGGDPDEVLARLAELGLTPANVNGAGQVVAAGTFEALAALAADPPARTRVIPLQVAGAFHTIHMAPAVDELAARAATVTPADPRITLLSNADGAAITSGPTALSRLVAQVANPVRWDRCQVTMQELGVTGLLELAPAGVLTGLARRTLPGVETVAVKTPADLDAARDLVRRHLHTGTPPTPHSQELPS
ncbi:ACP S-malonyltransferase [Pengzhenrongella frigida]|uniref:Malonyl CoA-acyl carrier protein transacylase n=1 Tax=Pengzhenrongella frigida TaxID=1259133 RepID=A0A4Q5N321_9MICO|nr:ACP S-malonyltransferase [Cellulomonas sp. HLT2-17]RYV52598.1 ACP S-malonyltransferase [Cellulomonas sp. HLT2-17]